MDPLVLLSDFGNREHYAACMKGVALSVHPSLKIFDLTHSIEPFNIWEASITISNTIHYWPSGTVFVAVVDPGVGTGRRSVAVRTARGHFIICPDNGILTFIREKGWIDQIRQIDVPTRRRPGSGDHHTFHGRDVYVYAGAKLACGKMSYDHLDLTSSGPVIIGHQKASIHKNILSGTLLKVEEPFGNLVTNIPAKMLDELYPSPHGHLFHVKILEGEAPRFQGKLPCLKSFGYAKLSQPLIYKDSSGMTGLARNQARFSEKGTLRGGSQWKILIEP